MTLLPMIREKSGVIKRIKDFAPECVLTHCFLHRESLATKKLSNKLNNVLCEVVKIVNHIERSPLNSRLFTLLCDDMQANHKELLFHSSVRWLSSGKVLSRMYELSNELVMFFHDKKSEWAQLFRDEHWLAMLAYLSDIFVIFNDLNTSMQGRNALLFATADKIDGIQRKLKAWKFRVLRNRYDKFQHLTSVIENAGENLNVKTIKNTTTEHSTNLINHIQDYFPEQNDPRRGNEWIRNPFASNVNVEELNVSVDLKDKLLELSANEGLHNCFKSISFANFWIKMIAEYPRLSDMAITTLLPFPSKYLCEAGFSTMTYLKGKRRNAPDIHALLRVARSSIEPQLDNLTEKKQVHISH